MRNYLPCLGANTRLQVPNGEKVGLIHIKMTPAMYSHSLHEWGTMHDVRMKAGARTRAIA
jgi:hypothetical protein